MAEDPALRAYRRVVAAFVLLGAVIAACAGGVLLWRGLVFEAFLALLAVGFFTLLAYGYRQDQEERDRRA
jgi:hypothetical protein